MRGNRGIGGSTNFGVLLLFAALCTCSIILIILTRNNSDSQRVSFGFPVISALQRGIGNVWQASANIFASAREVRRLSDENEQLLRRLHEYELQRGTLDSLQAEVARLTELLTLSRRQNYRIIAARVIAKDPSTIFSALTLDKGSRDGINVGMPITTIQDGGQALVGRIQQVSHSTAMVIPIVDPNSYVAARFQRTRLEGILQGNGLASASLTMRYVDARGRDAIQYNDMIVTSGLSSVYPVGIPIGRVSEIYSKSHEITIELGITPAVDFGRLEYVFIIMDAHGLTENET